MDTVRQTCAAKVEHYLSEINAKQSLNAFLEVFDEEAIEQARTVDQKIASGAGGKLAGYVVGLKDVLAFKDRELQASSKILEGFKSQYTATTVKRLLDEDAVIIGRQNCDEFAMGSSNENSAYGPVLNPINHNRVPGGSSGGSAAAVAAGLCDVALGTDTGGSVRQPAAFCGIIGLKPTYSRVSRYGLLAYASSFDVVGIMAKTIREVAQVLEVIAGYDPMDSTSSTEEVKPYASLLDDNRKFRVGYFNEVLQQEALQPEIKDDQLRFLEFLKSDGHEVEAIDFPLLEYALPTYYILTTAEASSNLSRYDGVKYGYRAEEGTNLEEMYKETRMRGFGEEVIRRIMLGTHVLSASYYDAYYTKAQKVRRLIKEALDNLLRRYDYIIMPTSPTTAFALGAHTQHPLEMYLADLFTVPASVAGIPAISIPGSLDKEGLPIGLQIMTASYQESQLLSFSNYILANKSRWVQ